MTSTLRASVLALVVGLAACGGGGGGATRAEVDEAKVPEAERSGGTMVAGAAADIPDINPLTSTDYYANQLQMFMLFTPLVRYNERFEPEPWGAKSWEVNADTTELTFHLRDDLYWHDGVKTTAYDWKFSYDLARTPETAFPNTAFWTRYGAAEAVDSFTFRVKMKPHAEYLDPWRSFTAVPMHVLKGVTPAELKNHPFSTSKPVGNGPFRFVSRQVGQNWIFEANPDFPKELGGRPYLNRVVYRVIPEPTTQLTELLTGRLDYYTAPSPEQAARIKNSGTARLLSFPNRSFVLIGWNERRPLFKDVRVRRALTMAIDRQGIIDGVLYGYGEIANSTVPSFYWNHDPQAGADLKYDPEAAKRLLAEAGWMDRNGDGVLENEQGVPFRFTLKTNQGNAERKDITEKVQADLRKVGIVAEPKIVEWGTLLNDLQNPKTRNFDAVVIGWTTEFRIDDTDLFSCRKLDEPFQWVGYCDPQTDRLMDMLPTIMDRAAAKPVWAEYQRKIAHDQPYTFLYYQQRLEGVSNRLRGVHPDARGDWVGVQKWWILPDQRRGDG